MLSSDPVRRAIRTWIQAFVGVFAVSLIGYLNAIQEWAATDGANFPAVDTLGKALMAALAAAAAAVVSFIVNLLEDTGAIPAALKAPASDGAKPVPAPGAP